ncbi:toll/interleukin-1 receptor domain-containing protein [Gracilimonas sp.]|uniref:toll/interleukin-1 receptor domain-containing protein n=1 Tax=Gracilimonas sp. TaxID=1974203 RepID=UPI0032ECBE32
MVDFFISYNKQDSFMAQRLKGWLEEVGYSCMMQSGDFGTGSNFVLKMDEAAKKAKRTIAVLSPDYLASKFTQPEWAAAFAKDPTGEFQFLIPIRVRECSLEGLLSQIVYLDLVGLSAMEMKKKLLSDIDAIINKKRKPSDLKSSEKIMKQKPDSYIKQIAKGDGNIQVGRDYIQTDKKVIRKEIIPSEIHITEEDAFEVKRLVGVLSKISEEAGKGSSYGEWYSKLYNTFKVTSYKTIPKEKYPDVIKWLRQQIGIKRKTLRRPNNEAWRKQTYKSIYTKATQMGFSNKDVHKIANERLDLAKPITSLKDLKERKLDELYKIFQRM